MFNLFSKISISLFAFSLLIHISYAGNSTPLDGCNPRGILDYQSLGIPQGVGCVILAITPGAPDPYPSSPVSNISDSTQVITFPSSGTFSYSMTCTGSNSTPASDTATFVVTIPASCNAAGTITGNLTLNASAPSGGQCTVTGTYSATISSGTTEKRAQVRFGDTLNAQFGIPDSGLTNTFNINVGTSITGILGVADVWDGPTIGNSLDTKTVTCGSGTGPGTGFCGDSSIQTPNAGGINEQCDLGSQNGVAGSACSATCQTQTVTARFCGDGIVQTPNDANFNEQCDLGNAANGNGNGPLPKTCSTSCTTNPNPGTQCGNGSLDAGEQCDSPAFTCGGSNTCLNCQCIPPGTVRCEQEQVVNIRTSQGGISASGLPTDSFEAIATMEGASVQNNQPCSLQLFNSSGFRRYEGSGYFGSNSNQVVFQNIQLTTPGVFSGRIDCQARYGLQWTSQSQCEAITINVSNQTPIDIGWTLGYTPKTKTVLVPVNEDLFITTGGQTGCTITENGNPWVTSANSAAGYEYDVSNKNPGTYTYLLNCPSATPSSISAELIVTSGPNALVTCSPSTQVLSGSNATIDWNGAALNNNPVCTVNGNSLSGTSDSYIATSADSYAFTCSNDKGVSQTATCTVTNPGTQLYSCSGNCGPCGGPSQLGCVGTTYTSPQACTNACQSTLIPDLDAACITNPVVTPASVRSGQQFTVSVPFTNTGAKSWNPNASTYAAYATSGTFSWNTSRPLLTTISGSPSLGIFTPSFTFTAPSVSVQTSFNLSFRMAEKAVPFGLACAVSGTGSIVVDPAECNDGIDNTDPEDILSDGLDPGCWTNPTNPETYNLNDNDERDLAPGAVLKISANPQLVRQKGSSNVSYEVSSCSVLNSEGELVPGPWTLTRDGTSVDYGTETSGGSKIHSVSNIETKTTFVLGCGGSSKSATISVIKINEI